MKDQVTLTEMAGKTISHVYQNDDINTGEKLHIIYTDGTYTRLAIDRGYSDGDQSFLEQELDIYNMSKNDLAVFAAHGVITEEEVIAEDLRRTTDFNNRQKISKEQRRKAYETLKKEFGDE